MARVIRHAALMGALLVTVLASPAGAASFLEKNFWLSGPRYDAIVPPCDYPPALAQIQSRFAAKEGQFWNSALEIVDFVRVHEVAFRTWAVDTMPRRFCSGQVLVSDGIKRRVNYSIIEDGGLIGASWGVEWCVVGLDRNWAYNPACKMALP